MKKTLSYITPVLFLILGCGILWFFEYYLKDNIDTVDVVVAKENIPFKGKISDGDIEIKKVRRDNAISGGYNSSDTKLIVDKYAAIDIKKGTQIYPSLIDSYDLIPNEKEGEFIAPIPDSWLFAVPGSLRKSFVADFYVIPDKEQAMLRAIVQESTQHSEKEEGKPVKTDKTIDNELLSNKEPVLKDVRVASVKDRSNKEVKENTEVKDAATGVISNLEIIANGETLTKLRDYTEQGYKIYVVYKYERSNEGDKS
ncbi:SAF domain-containing protein [Cytobacillus oceanisediminis]|uniref:SAF domain-containing protein n=1 Tax=Cytobacillus oceanisediminis TaxID=665099 RepID=UPI001C221541|nr:SAF domain-containing protein [Cytobacillus oceanisediminis]MBU8732500.1 SAF domain-containing protein [Cytobacillus oceanisediminis]